MWNCSFLRLEKAGGTGAGRERERRVMNSTRFFSALKVSKGRASDVADMTRDGDLEKKSNFRVPEVYRLNLNTCSRR